MNRQLKYRVWITDWGNAEPPSHMVYIEDLQLHIYLCNWERGGYKDAIFQQWTGLKDIKGRDIYEGDIIQQNGNIFRVVFSETVAGFVLDPTGRHNIDEKYGDYIPMHRETKYQVLGNIYKTPNY